MNNNNNAIVNNGQVPSLTTLAFKAFLRARKTLNSNNEIPQTLLPDIEQRMIPDFLQAIANADPKAVQAFLDGCPELLVIARGTVTGASGYTYENVSPIELAYLMDDDELMREMLLPAIQKLTKEMIENANMQLANKMTEVEKLRAQFKPYDFSEMVNAIANDQTLENTRKPNEDTQKALEKFKDDFKPGSIKEGKSWIKEQLQEAYRVYDENFAPWNGTQLNWYLVNVVGHIQTLVEKCFEQECSQGLIKIVGQKKPNARSIKIENLINDKPVTFRGTADLSLVLGFDFFVDIISGEGSLCGVRWCTQALLKNYFEQKHQNFQKLNSTCNLQPRHTK